MNKALAIKQLYPNAEFGIDFEVVDHMDGRGQIISKWELDTPLPSDEELNAAWEEYLQTPQDNPSIEDELAKLQEEKERQDIVISTLQTQLNDQIELNNSNKGAIMELSMMVSLLSPLPAPEEDTDA